MRAGIKFVKKIGGPNRRGVGREIPSDARPLGPWNMKAMRNPAGDCLTSTCMAFILDSFSSRRFSWQPFIEHSRVADSVWRLKASQECTMD